MCGIAGIVSGTQRIPKEESNLERMIGALHHRGPDECGLLFDSQCAMGMSRLSIIDLSGGSQPICNEDKSLWIVFNGEIFNYPELRTDLKSKGHEFRTRSDTEVIIHCFEQYGLDFVGHLNGQFAIAIWDRADRRLILARDRIGIRPLFYAVAGDRLIFGSEMKAIFAQGSIKPEIVPEGLADIFTFWVNVPPGTIFKGINELPPGHTLCFDHSGIRIQRYWDYTFPEEQDFLKQPEEQTLEAFRELLMDAVTIRLRADVPVAAYLSGGIDSSVISAMVKHRHNNDLITFSVAFKDRGFDERAFQEKMVSQIGTRHHTVEVGTREIADDFSNVVWFAEKPLMRTAPAPLFALSRCVRENGIKVVLTGEGADEFLGGYNIFKEDKIRRFCARRPESKCRPLLFSRLYPYIVKSEGAINPFWQAFFTKHLEDTENPYYSHLLRWENTSHIKNIFRPHVKQHFKLDKQVAKLDGFCPPEIMKWHPLNRAQYLEASLFLNGYLLSSQGDRMMMGNSVEGRFPFLDHRLVEFTARLRPELKIRALNEKYILKKAFSSLIPEAIVTRPKQPYRAPITDVLAGRQTSRLLKKMLSPEYVEKYCYLNPKAVERLKKKISRTGENTTARDEMALVAAGSTQLLHYHFLEEFDAHEFHLPAKVKLVDLV